MASRTHSHGLCYALVELTRTCPVAIVVESLWLYPSARQQSQDSRGRKMV